MDEDVDCKIQVKCFPCSKLLFHFSLAGWCQFSQLFNIFCQLLNHVKLSNNLSIWAEFFFMVNRLSQLIAILNFVYVTFSILQLQLWQNKGHGVHRVVLERKKNKFNVHQCQARIEIWHSPEPHLTTWPSSDFFLILTRPLPNLD